MPAPNPKKDLSNTTGSAQQSAYPLDRYTVPPKANPGSGDEKKNPYYQPSAPTISLPKGGGALKSIDEKFSVNAENGTAGMQVPLPLTTGRSGFTPSLALSYNSGGGNTEFGLGWSIGLNAIQRRTDKKLPMYDDVNESDVFVLSGAEDLQPLLVYSGGEWVQDIVVDGSYTLKRYRPRIEGLYARIENIFISGDAHSWWKVTTKENVVTFYGLTAAGRISDPENDARIYKWLPQLTFDNKGNVQQYFYVTDDNPSIIPHALHEQNRINGLAPFTNTYLNNVAYCNCIPFTPSSDYQPEIAASFDGTGAPEYMMLMVMDYGNYDANAPTPYDSLPLPCRVDAFSDFHAGFEIRTYRRCMRALMFHFFDELNGGSPVLVKSADFGWQTDSESPPPDYAEADYIVSITQNGYLLQDDGTYFKKSLPAMTMAYQPLVWDNTMYNVSPEDAENAPQGLTGPYQWIDMWGEGIPGILTEQAHGWFYKRNLGNGHFAPSLAVVEKPSMQGLGTTLQWTDLEADGRRQLVSKDSAVPGYFELDDEQEWLPFRAFKEWIDVDWNSPFTRVLDLNGDGRPDLLITEERAWRWYENAGTEGYVGGGYGPTSYDEEKAPRLLLNDMMQVIFLADMNGDGITDIVRIQNGEVCYWPNIGYGRFGAKVTMSNAPWFDRQDIFNPQYIILADISGTGAADLIYIGHNKCTAWINYAGNAWSSATDIAPLPGTEMYSKITVVDFLGSGTSCIVWSSPLPQHAWAPMRYIDLMGGNKPYLMTSYYNGMGKTVELAYKQSTQYYLEDMMAGTPWATMLPFPVHCVSEVTTTDDVSQTTYTQQYSYHHGYYDHPEREFRGFGRVDTIDTDSAIAYIESPPGSDMEDDLDQYPVLTKTWYHTGAWMREGTLLEAFATEYYPITWAELPTSPVLLPAPLSPPQPFTAQDEREAYRAMKGQFLRQEVYAQDGSALQPVPYTIVTNALCVQQVQPVATNLYGSFYCYVQQNLTYSCERNVNDPRVMHQLTLAVDEYGNVLEAAKVAYPRQGLPSPPVPAEVADVQSVMLCSYTTTAYTNDILTGAYRLRMPCDEQSYQLTGMVLSADLWTVATLQAAINGASPINYTDTPDGSLQTRMISESRTLYLADDAVTVLSLGVMDTLGLAYQQYHLSFAYDMLGDAAYYNGLVTDAMLAEGGYLREDLIPQFGTGVTTNYWLPGGTVTYDPVNYYVPTAYTDPWGNATTVAYWDTGGANYYLLPKTITDAIGNVTTAYAYNWYCLQPVNVEDPNNNVSEMMFDALGMPVAMALMAKNDGTQGDTLHGIDPQSSTDIANQAAFFTDPESVAGELLQGATWRCVYDLSASPVAVGMIGREFHYYDTADSPPSSPPDNGLVIRLTYTDGLGRIAMSKVQAAPDEGGTDVRWIGSGKTVYNNKGNVVMQYEPYFSATPIYDSAEQASILGVTPRLHYDPLGRVLWTDLPDGSYTQTEWDAWMQVVYDNNDTVLSSQWYANAMAGSPEQQDAAAKAAHHNDTPTTTNLDTLARPFYTVQHNRIPDSSSPPDWIDYYYDSYTDLDIQGNRIAIHDARGNTAFTYSYNMINADVQLNSVDSGIGLMLTDVSGQPLYAWDADGREFHHTYDVLRRPLTREVTFAGPGATNVLEVLVYGETVSTPEMYNLRGQIYQTFDGVGRKTIPEYDFKGNPLEIDQQLLSDSAITDVDWSSSPALDTEVFSSTITYDALSRPITTTDPGGNVTWNVYEEGGMLYSVYLTPNGGTESAYVENIFYNAKNQRLGIYYGNGTGTEYIYDADTFRLTRLLTTGNGNTYQDLNYWYDPVGNVTTLKDASQRALYFNNSIILPEQSYTYDALYRLITATGREQIGTATFGSTDNYNDAAWMGISQPGNDNNCQNYIQQYAYDEVGNILSLQHIADAGSYTRSYTYGTANNQLLSTAVGTYTYNYTYDTRGNVNGMPQLSGVTYNADNYMGIAGLGGGGDAYYQYSKGQRGRKTIINGAITYERIYLGSFEIFRKYISGTLELERTTVHVNDDTGRIAMLEMRTEGTDSSAASLMRYIYSNHISTATLELDDNAAIISYEEYHPYGTTSYQAMNASINAVAKRYRFTAKERDEETGLYYIGARYYAPWLTRWMACDPINYDWYNLVQGQQGRNKERGYIELTASTYEYCYANPVRFTDPKGEQAPAKDSAPATTPTHTGGDGKMTVSMGGV